MAQAEIALLMSTYQRPRHLRLALQSIARQQGVDGRFELVITDDGSTDETSRIVAEFAAKSSFRVGFTTHLHTTFRLSRCRNEGVKASTAPYLLFLDGDCVLPPDHVRIHLEKRKPGIVMAGDCCRLEQAMSECIGSDELRRGQLEQYASAAELARLRKLDRSSRFYQLIRHRTKPKLIGNNVGIWRKDYKRVNGYDENFQGWGCEDDDLRLRLRRAGTRIESILRWTRTYHLWHPTDVTAPTTWKQGANVSYLLRPGRLTRCLHGLETRNWDDLSIHVVGDPRKGPRQRAEVEILVLPGKGRFSGRAECNVLVARNTEAARSPAAKAAHHVVIATSDRGDSQGVPAWQHLVEKVLGLTPSGLANAA